MWKVFDCCLQIIITLVSISTFKLSFKKKYDSIFLLENVYVLIFALRCIQTQIAKAARLKYGIHSYAN